MSKKLLATALTSAFITGLLAMNVQAHDGSGKHIVVDSSGNAVMSSSGCVTSSGGTGTGADTCGSGTMAKAEMAAPAMEEVKSDSSAMMDSTKAMGSSHSHPANHCTRSMVHTHAAPSGHTHRYSCKSNKMASPRQVAG